jgi:hypothetical protein
MSSESEDGDKISSTAQALPAIERSNGLGSDAHEYQKAFLSSFSPEEDRAIRRKVDFRFLWLIGVMYIIKNVSPKSLKSYTETHDIVRSTTRMLLPSKCSKLASLPTF